MNEGLSIQDKAQAPILIQLLSEDRSPQSQLQSPQVESHFRTYKNIMNLIRDILDPKVLLALDSPKKTGTRKELLSFQESIKENFQLMWH